MKHRHIIENSLLSLAAIDDIIERGGVDDWRKLKDCADADMSLLSKILKVCAAKVSDPYAQRYHLWDYYAKHAVAQWTVGPTATPNPACEPYAIRFGRG